MRHTVQVMLGGSTQEALLALKKYTLKHGTDNSADYLTAIHVTLDAKSAVIKKAVPCFKDGARFEDSYEVFYDELFLWKDVKGANQSQEESLRNFFVSFINSELNVCNDDYGSLLFNFYIPLFEQDSWPAAKKLIDIIKSTEKNVAIDVLGLCADMSEFLVPVAMKKPYGDYVATTCKVMDDIVDYNKDRKISHFIAIDNKQQKGVSLNLTSDLLLSLLGEYALITSESYDAIFMGLRDKKELCTFGLATLSVDRFFFIEFLLHRTFLYALEKERITDKTVDINKMVDISERVLGKWTHLMSEFMEDEIVSRRQKNKTDGEIIAEITPPMQKRFAELAGEIDSYIKGDELSLPEKKMLLIAMFGWDDSAMSDDIFNEDHLIIDDLERESINVFINYNNALLSLKETKEDALLSKSLLHEEPLKEVFYPLDAIKAKRTEIQHCLTTIREHQKNIVSIKSQMADRDEAEKVLINDGKIIFKGQTFKLLPDVVDPPLAENYVPHYVSNTSIDLRKGFTDVKNQGQIGSCLSHAIVSVYEYFLRNNGLETPDLSELFLYYNARKRGGNVEEDEGSSIGDSMSSLAEEGICSEDAWPYKEENFAVQPPQTAYEDAKNRKVKTSLNVELSLNAIKSAVEDGLPVIGEFVLYESFAPGRDGMISLPSAEERERESHGRHAMVICGFSEENKIFIVRNSWGADWGDKGYCYMPYAYVENPELMYRASVIKEIATTKEVEGQETIVHDSVFGVRKENLAHVEFDRSDANTRLMLELAALSNQSALLEKLKKEYNDYTFYYQSLKTLLIDRNIHQKLRDSSIERLRIEIEAKEKERNIIETEKFDVLKSIGRRMVLYALYALIAVIIITSGAFVVNKIIKKNVQPHNKELVQPNSFLNKLSSRSLMVGFGLDGIVILVTGVVLLYLRKKKRDTEEEYNSQITFVGTQKRNLESEKTMIPVKFFIASSVLTRLFTLDQDLQTKHNKLKSFINNLNEWYDQLLSKEEICQQSAATTVHIIDEGQLVNFFNSKKDEIVREFCLTSLLDGFELSEDGLAKLKKDVEDAVINGIKSCLDGFSIYSYASGTATFPFLPPVAKGDYFGCKLEEMGEKSKVFQQYNSIAGATNPLINIFINVSDDELNTWSTIYPKSFSFTPNSVRIRSKYKVMVMSCLQVDRIDLAFYTNARMK